MVVEYCVWCLDMGGVVKPLRTTAVVTFRETQTGAYQFSFLLPRHRIDGLGLYFDYHLRSFDKGSRLCEELLARCLKGLRYRVYSVLWFKSRYRELFGVADRIYGYGNYEVFEEYLNILNLIGFGEDRRGAKRVFYADLEGIILFVVESEEGKKLVEKHEEEVIEYVKKEKDVAFGPYSGVLMGERYIMELLNKLQLL